MKLLYISSICNINSFGEVSRKYIKMFENYSNWDVYLYNINSTISNNELNIELSGNIKGIEYLPDYYVNDNNHKQTNLYLTGCFHINKYIIDLNPDIVIILSNDLNIYNFEKSIQQIRPFWKGLFVPFIPVDLSNLRKCMFNIDYDACLTMNEWSVNEIMQSCDNRYPVYSCPHIVNEFETFSHQEKKRLRKKFHGAHSDKYIIGCVNANNSRKRYDLVIKSFIKFYKYNSNSILYIKTTKFESGGPVISFNFDKFIDNYPIFITTQHLSSSELCELYNTFDIMINPTDGEGFGLTPFEAAMCDTLTILPNNSSYKSLIINDKIPYYLIPCEYIPYGYARSTEDVYSRMEGKELFCIYYDFKSQKNKSDLSDTFIPLIPNTVPGVTTYILSKILKPDNIIFSDMESIFKENWDVLQIQILVTSDIKTLRYLLQWLKENSDCIWPGKLRERLVIKTKSIDELVGFETSLVGIVNVEDLFNIMVYYFNNNEQYKSDLSSLKEFVTKNYNEKAVWNTFKSIMAKLNLK